MHLRTNRLFRLLFAVIVGISLASFLARWAFIVWPILCVLLFLRFAQDLPFLGGLWMSLFGERTLRDWLSLMIVPVVLTTIGFQFSSMKSDEERDNSIKTMRAQLFQKYLEMIQEYVTDGSLSASRGRRIDAKADASSSQLAEEQPDDDCRIPSQSPTALFVQNITESTLSQLQLLKTSQQNDVIQENGMIFRFLHGLGLLNRGSNTISLRGFNFERSDFYQRDLRNTCLTEIMFADSAVSLGSASDFRYADLDHANLRGSNLARANLGNANLRRAVLTGWASLYRADLRGADLRNIKYDQTTNFDGAIYNTQAIKFYHTRKGLLGSLLCGSHMRIFAGLMTCRDPKNYTDIPPTRFPDSMYSGLPDRRGEGGVVSNRKLEELTKIGLVEVNSLP